MNKRIKNKIEKRKYFQIERDELLSKTKQLSSELSSSNSMVRYYKNLDFGNVYVDFTTNTEIKTRIDFNKDKLIVGPFRYSYRLYGDYEMVDRETRNMVCKAIADYLYKSKIVNVVKSTDKQTGSVDVHAYLNILRDK